VDVEAGGRLEVAHVEVDMAYCRLRVDGRLRLLVGNRLEQGVQIEWSRAAAHDGEIGPLLLRPVGGELDAVPIRIRKVDGLRDPVVGSALDRSSRVGEACGGARELAARRMEEGEVVEACVPAGGPGIRVFDEDEEVLAARAK